MGASTIDKPNVTWLENHQMSTEISSGPRVITEAANQLIQCPQSVLDPTNFTSFVERITTAQDNANKVII